MTTLEICVVCDGAIGCEFCPKDWTPPEDKTYPCPLCDDDGQCSGECDLEDDAA